VWVPKLQARCPASVFFGQTALPVRSSCFFEIMPDLVIDLPIPLGSMQQPMKPTSDLAPK
jgi:hypothetical protein